MLEKFKKLYNSIKELNKNIDKYQDETVIQSLPSVALVNKAKKLIEQKKFAQAQLVLQSALDLSNNDPLVFKYLGKIREYYRDYALAAGLYNKSAELNPNDKEIWLRLGMSLLYSDNFENAIVAFEKANKRTPNNTDVFTGWGMAYMRLKKYALARDKFNTAARISKYNYSAILLSAVMEKRLGEYNSAEEKLSFLVKVAPNEGSMYEFANLKLMQKKYEEAEIYAKKILEYNKQMLPGYFLLGEIYSIKNDCQNCIDTYNMAIENDLDCSSLHFEWGKSYIRLLNFEKAKEQFEIALEKENDFIEPQIGLALIAAYENDFLKINEYKEKYSQNVYIVEGLGLEQLHSGDYKQAIHYFNKALHIDNNQNSNYLNLAKCYMALKNNDKTRECFEKFTKLYPENVESLIDYSDWLVEVCDFEDARRKLEKAQKIAPENLKILNRLFFVQYTLVKKNVSEYNIKEAISTSHQAIALGNFEYYPQMQELEHMLNNIREDK